MPEKFEIKKSKDGQYYFNLIAPNNEIIATSEMYRYFNPAMYIEVSQRFI